MASMMLLDVLEDLEEKEFKDFKWFLQQPGHWEGCEAIKKSRLEKAEARDTVDVMVQTYGDTAAVEVTRKVLEKISRNDLVQSLCGSSSEPGGEKLPSGQEDPACSLDTLRLEPGGDQLAPVLRKYSCRLTIDTNTVSRDLQLSDNNRKVTCVTVQSYPDHPDRFDYWKQLLCSNGLTGRCYWEVEWTGDVFIAVSYRGISRKGDSKDCVFGFNHQSWSLVCSNGRYCVRHNKSAQTISSSVTNRVSVFVDCPAGSLSFYSVSSDKLIHLHTFTNAFTEPLYPGFGVFPGSSVSLCDV